MNVKTAEILRTRVFSVLPYATETWTLNKMDQDTLLAFEMLQKITKVPMAAENNMNVEVKHRMNNSENTVQLCGHICGMRDGRMVKKLVFGAMGGKPGKDGGSG